MLENWLISFLGEHIGVAVGIGIIPVAIIGEIAIFVAVVLYIIEK